VGAAQPGGRVARLNVFMRRQARPWHKTRPRRRDIGAPATAPGSPSSLECGSAPDRCWSLDAANGEQRVVAGSTPQHKSAAAALLRMDPFYKKQLFLKPCVARDFVNESVLNSMNF
jgi:hypothetical protein